MVKVVVVGGGWSGCAAALAATKAGAQVTLLERTDLLLGTGLVGGIFRNNGRFTAAEECIALGGGELFQVMDAVARHKNLSFPGHEHASLYDVNKIEPEVCRCLQQAGVVVCKQNRVVDVVMQGKCLQAVVTERDELFAADVFVDATGTAGGMGNCLQNGNGCAMCVLRCPSFGPRVSIVGKCGVKEFKGLKADGTYGAMSGSCKLSKESLHPDLVQQLETNGKVVIPLPPSMVRSNILGKKACSQYALQEYAQNIVLLDTGHAKLMTSYYPLEELRKVPGLETVRFVDPYAGGRGNSIRYHAIAPCDYVLKVVGVNNLFCGGEKSGVLVGHTEAVATGLLAGHNAVRSVLGKSLLELPECLAIGDYIRFLQLRMQSREGLKLRYTFSGSVYFERMQEHHLYSFAAEDIHRRVEQTGLSGVYSQPLV